MSHKARLVAGGDWTFNERYDIYSGVVGMDTVRIVLFFGGMYELSYFACDIVNAFIPKGYRISLYNCCS
jgi:hypothetical protein